MICAYSELYLNDAQASLSQCFDYLINDCRLDADWAAVLFTSSDLSGLFERGNPRVIAGMSGLELAVSVIRETYQEMVLPEPARSQGLTPEYWAGWSLAVYQWKSALRFADIFSSVSFSEIVRMYPAYHEMDLERFLEAMHKRCENRQLSRLKMYRERTGLSQSQLAAAAGVGLRSIQMYEQGVNDIDKAQAYTLYKISRVLGCGIEDLLQNL